MDEVIVDIILTGTFVILFCVAGLFVFVMKFSKKKQKERREEVMKIYKRSDNGK